MGLDFEFLYARGKINTAADALSRRYAQDPVDIDIRLDPNGDDLPYERLAPTDLPMALKPYRIADMAPPTSVSALHAPPTPHNIPTLPWPWHCIGLGALFD